MGDDRIDGADICNGFESCLVIQWNLVGPVEIRLQGIRRMEVVVLAGLPPCALHGDCTTDAENSVAADLQDGIVWYGLPPFIVHLLAVEICRVIMVAPDEHYPIVILFKPFLATFVDVLIIARLLEAKTAVTSNNNKRIIHSLDDTHLVNQFTEITVDVTADHDALGIRVLVYVYIVVHLLFKVATVESHDTNLYIISPKTGKIKIPYIICFNSMMSSMLYLTPSILPCQDS